MPYRDRALIVRIPYEEAFQAIYGRAAVRNFVLEGRRFVEKRSFCPPTRRHAVLIDLDKKVSVLDVDVLFQQELLRHKFRPETRNTNGPAVSVRVLLQPLAVDLGVVLRVHDVYPVSQCSEAAGCRQQFAVAQIGSEPFSMQKSLFLATKFVEGFNFNLNDSQST